MTIQDRHTSSSMYYVNVQHVQFWRPFFFALHGRTMLVRLGCLKCGVIRVRKYRAL